MYKKFLSLVAAAGLLLVGGVQAHADPTKPYNWGTVSLAEDQAIMLVSEPNSEASNHSLLAVQPAATGNSDTRGSWYWCATVVNSACDPADPAKDLLAESIIPYCSESKSEVCLGSLELATADGAFQKANFIGYAKGGIHISADARTNLVEGTTPALFQLEGVPNQGGTSTYAVTVNLSQNFQHDLGIFTPTSIIANVTPYKVQTGAYQAMYFDPKAKAEEAYKGNHTAPGCAYVEDGSCGMRQDFTEGTKVRLNIDIPSSMGGWFSGRMQSPTISVATASPTINRVTVDAQSVAVPKLAFVKKKADISVEKTYNIGSGGFPGGTFWGVSAGGPGSENVADFVNLFRKPLNDTAVGIETMWSMMTIGGDQGSSCLADKSKVLGIVTTNSLGYDTTAPRYSDGFLNYNVTGLHYMPDGKTPVQGTYDLVMRSDTARCLYNFTSAPVSATVSVVGDGDTSIATTVVNEKDGWLKMAAYGFTFSDKTLKVKLSQKAETKPTPAKTTITCVKGKLTKKVTAVSPKCPAGYKKKG